MNIKFFATTALALFGGIVFAIPPALTFQNQPIDSLCFADIQNDSKVINLKNCGIKKEKYLKKGQNSTLIEKGYLGYNWQSSSPESPVQGYSYYKSFPAGLNLYWVYAINNGGGSGEFTAIYLVKRNDDYTVTIKTIGSGDRCNGGIQNVSAIHNQLHFDVNLTAYDLIALSPNKNPNIKAYDDLAACAVCCFAKASYELNSNQKPHFNFVQLENMSNPQELSEQGTYQTCFNQLFVSYVKAGTLQLQGSSLEEFVSKFNKLCLKKKSTEA